MRATFYAALALAALSLTSVPPARAPAAAHACPSSAGMADASKPAKPSSFAPRRRAPHNAYGAPVGDKILTKRTKKKPQSDPARAPAV